MRTVPAALAVILLASGCDRPEAPPPRAGVEPPAAPAPATPATPADASGLAFVDAAGAAAATLTCDAGSLGIKTPGFRPISSEDRLSLGADGEAFALVADLAAPGPGVTASGAPDPDLLARLSRGEALHVLYGRQSVGPLAASSPEALRAFVSACGESAWS